MCAAMAPTTRIPTATLVHFFCAGVIDEQPASRTSARRATVFIRNPNSIRVTLRFHFSRVIQSVATENVRSMLLWPSPEKRT